MATFFHHAERFSLLIYDSSIYDDFGAGGTDWDNYVAILMEDASYPTWYQILLPSKNGNDQVYVDGHHCITVYTGSASDLVYINQVINTALL